MRAHDPDWRDFFSIGVQDVIESDADHSYRRNLETSIDRRLARQQERAIRNLKRRIARREKQRACNL